MLNSPFGKCHKLTMKWAKVLLVVFALVEAISGVSAQTDSYEEDPESLKFTVDKLFQIVEKLSLEILELKSSIQANNNEDLQEWKGKVVTLENKVTQQDSLLALVKAPYPKNCEEIRLNDDSKESGTYWIDPDGNGFGDPAIQVYCDMTTGTTLVSHDRQNLTDVGHCKAPGCFSQEIKYHGSLRQIAALIEQSSHCHQLIEYQCFSAPLAFNGIQYSWWEDRHGHNHYFWSGSKDSAQHSWMLDPDGYRHYFSPHSLPPRSGSQDSGHRCHCHKHNECYDPSLTCNCDSLAPLQLNDTGLISSKHLLPITRVHFGRTISPMSSGQYRLGQLECRGFARLEKMPESCDDLKKIGHSLSGFYSVQKSGEMATVYCDMAKLPGDSDLERRIRTSDRVYFYVQRTENDWLRETGSIPFDEEVLNVGQAIDLESGLFTATTAGIYHFSFMFMANSATVVMKKNEDAVIHRFSPYYNNHYTITVPAIVDLDAGDTIQLILEGGSIMKCHFVGMLLQPRDAN